LQSDSNGKPCKERDVAFRNAFARYLEATGIDFAYWPLKGDQLPGCKRRNGDVESYGLLRPDWSEYAPPDFVTAITK
jgi:endoglucanase